MKPTDSETRIFCRLAARLRLSRWPMTLPGVNVPSAFFVGASWNGARRV
jgi:hypothetical protein